MEPQDWRRIDKVWQWKILRRSVFAAVMSTVATHLDKFWWIDIRSGHCIGHLNFLARCREWVEAPIPEVVVSSEVAQHGVVFERYLSMTFLPSRSLAKVFAAGRFG